MIERMLALFARLPRLNFSIRRETQRENSVRCVPREEYLTRALGRFESFIIRVQKVLVWESPLLSCLCIGIVNLIFWLAISFQCRFYGILFTTLLIGYLYNAWNRQYLNNEWIWLIWTEISVPQETYDGDDWRIQSSSILSVPEISCYLSQALNSMKDYYIWLKTLRDTKPGLFCCGMCAFFILLTLIGRTVPGLVISYCLIMCLMIGPGLWIHLLHQLTIIQQVSNFRAGLRLSQDTDSEVEEYLPEQTGENLALLQLAGEANEEEANEESLIIAEFGLEPAEMSSLCMQDEGSTDGLSEFDLSAPLSKNSANHNERKYQNKITADLEASDTDEDDNVGTEEQIQFQSLHFNRDSSEEEELAFAQGLAFTENNPVPSQSVSRTPATGLSEMLTSTAVQSVAKNIANVGAMGRSLLSTVVSGTTQVPVREVTREESSSGESEDFEMISRDDIP